MHSCSREKDRAQAAITAEAAAAQQAAVATAFLSFKRRVHLNFYLTKVISVTIVHTMKVRYAVINRLATRCELSRRLDVISPNLLEIFVHR